ncbi:MAG: hypothetical protein IK954_08140 [Clostridia bacterium]|nr:hypothetical protein [Clostridia bacterium]
MKKFAKILAAVGSLLLLFSVGGMVALLQIVNDPVITAALAPESAPTLWNLLFRTHMLWPLIISLLLLIGAVVILVIQWYEKRQAAKAEKAERKAEREERKADRKKHKETEEEILEELEEETPSEEA